jgi:hypothetical protein
MIRKVAVPPSQPHFIPSYRRHRQRQKEEAWNIEVGAAGRLAAGVTRDSLKVGDPVIVTGNPAMTPLINAFGW